MHCEIQLLDAENNPWFVGKRDLPGEFLLELAAKRVPMLQEKGIDFAQGAIPAMAGELVRIVKAKDSEDAIDKAVIELALATLTVEKVLGIEDAALLDRNIYLTVYENGAVKYDRLDSE